MNATIEKPITATEPKAKAVSPGLTEKQILNRLRKLDAIEAQIKTLEADKQRIRAEILGDAEAVTIDSDVLKLDAGKEAYKRFDSTSFKKDMPDAYERYLVTAFRAKFRYKIK